MNDKLELTQKEHSLTAAWDAYDATSKKVNTAKELCDGDANTNQKLLCSFEDSNSVLQSSRNNVATAASAEQNAQDVVNVDDSIAVNAVEDFACGFVTVGVGTLSVLGARKINRFLNRQWNLKETNRTSN